MAYVEAINLGFAEIVPKQFLLHKINILLSPNRELYKCNLYCINTSILLCCSYLLSL